MPPDLPTEITVVDRGPDDITFLLPRRDIGPLRHLGWLILAVTGVFLYWVVWLGVTNITRLNRPVQVEDGVMLALGIVLGCSAYFPIMLGLAILAGRREIRLRGGQLFTSERVGFLRRTKRWPIEKLTRIEFVSFTPSAAKAKEGTLLSRLEALAGVLGNGTRFMIAPAYPRRLLAPLAAELAARCNARFDAADRPAVEITTFVHADPRAEANPDVVERPANSRAVVDEYAEGMTITLPPTGYRGLGGILLTIGGIMVGLMAGLIPLVRGAPGFLYGIFVLIGFVGLLLAIHGVRVARRRVVIAVVGTRLLILQTGLVRSKEREWEAADLAAVRVDKSGIKINEVDVLELQIVPQLGQKFGLLAGRDLAEIRWLAGELRRRLAVGVQATK
jgi:hypothetical protein